VAAVEVAVVAVAAVEAVVAAAEAAVEQRLLPLQIPALRLLPQQAPVQ
jgi:hypothetical protein